MADILHTQGGLTGSVAVAAEQKALVAGTVYRFVSSSNCVIRYTTAGGTDAAATPTAGDVVVGAFVPTVVKLGNGNTHLSVIRITADGVYTLTPVLGY